MAAQAAERDLLFGLLALQNGLINQGQLVAAVRVLGMVSGWTVVGILNRWFRKVTERP
jgi:hypothetical protein